MSLNLNRVQLAGNLTREPEVRFLPNDKAVASFTIATNRRWKDGNGEQKEEVTFVDIETWGRTAELVGQYLTKGRGCFIEGRLKLEQWDDKESGAKRSKLKVVADSVQFTDSKQDRAEPAGDEPAPAPRRPVDTATVEDLPPF